MEMEEPELRPEVIENMKKIAKQKKIRVDDFAKRYGIKEEVDKTFFRLTRKNPKQLEIVYKKLKEIRENQDISL